MEAIEIEKAVTNLEDAFAAYFLNEIGEIYEPPERATVIERIDEIISTLESMT